MPSDSTGRPSIGILAVKAGAITQQQLMECLHVQQGEDRPLEEILVAKGYLTREKIAELQRTTESAVRAKPSGESGVTKMAPDRGTGTRTKQMPGPAVRGTSTRMRAPVPPGPPPVPGAPPATPAPIDHSGPKDSSGRIPAPFFGAVTPQPGGGRGTSVRGKTGIRAKTGVRENTNVRKERRRFHLWILGGLLAVLPLAILGGLLLLDSGPGSTPPGPPPTPPPVVVTPPVPKEPPAPEPIRAKLPQAEGSDALANRWNGFADRVASCRSADDYAHMLDEAEAIIKDAKGSPVEDVARRGHGELIRCINRRADEVFGFIADDVRRLCEAGKYGLAVQTWDWFPLILDIGKSFEKRIAAEKDKTLAAGKQHYQDLKGRADKLVEERKYEDAKLVMLQALEIGLKDESDDAYTRITAIAEKEDEAARKREEEELKKFEEMAKAERESGQLIAVIRGQFWQMVSERRLDAAKALLEREKPGAPADVAKDIDVLRDVLSDLRAGFAAAAKHLEGSVGQTISLSLVQGGKEVVRTIRLKDVSGGRLIFSVEGKDLDADVSDLHATEMAKIAAAHSGESRAWLAGIAAMLADDFDRAFESLKEAGGKGRKLVAFVESSTAFLEKNAASYKKRAAGAMESKDYERAIVEYSRLVRIASERRDALRGRARAYYQSNNFVACVLDIEQLVMMDDLADEVLQLLAQSYERSSLIVKAIDVYEKARKRKPKHGGVMAALMKLYMQIHDYEKARQVFSEAKAVSPEAMGLKYLLDIAEEPAFTGQSYKAPWGRYDVFTNVSQAYAKETAFFMDAVYKEYAKVFPYKKNETLRFHVKIFATENEFQAYYAKVTGRPAAGVYGRVLAYYMPITKELVGWDAPDIKETLRHEGLHQFIDYFVNDCPIWFNEGFASYFEKSTADEAKFNPGRHNSCKAAMSMRMLPPMKDLLLMSAAAWQGDEKAVFYYGHAWSFIYYLIKNGQKSLLDKYFEEVMSGKTQKQAFDAVFGPGKASLGELESKWRKAVFNDDYEPR